MPETAVDKDGEAFTGKDDICANAQIGRFNRLMHAEAEASCVECRTKLALWCRVTRPVRAHDGGHSG
jgi:hypothetical protein